MSKRGKRGRIEKPQSQNPKRVHLPAAFALYLQFSPPFFLDFLCHFSPFSIVKYWAMLPNFIQFLPLLSLWESPPPWYPSFSRLPHPSPVFSLISISCTCYWLLNMLSFLDFNPFWTLDFLCWWHLLMSAEFNRFATYVSENAKTLVQLKLWREPSVVIENERQPSFIAVQRKRHLTI